MIIFNLIKKNNCNLFINSLVVVENLWDKSPHSNIFSCFFFWNQYTLKYPRKKSPLITLEQKFLEPFERGVFSSLAIVLGKNGGFKYCPFRGSKLKIILPKLICFDREMIQA